MSGREHLDPTTYIQNTGHKHQAVWLLRCAGTKKVIAVFAGRKTAVTQLLKKLPDIMEPQAHYMTAFTLDSNLQEIDAWMHLHKLISMFHANVGS